MVAHYAYGDAISNEARTIRDALRDDRVETVIVADHCDAGLDREMITVDDYVWREHDIIVLHYSIWSRTASWVLEQNPGRVLMIYHNVTPPKWFAGINPQAEAETRFAREVLQRFAPVVATGLGDSPYNQDELIEAGFTSTGVLPIMMDQDSLAEAYNTALAGRLRDGTVTWLFVGRIAPNKCQHDVVSAFAVYHRQINSRSRLVIVGSPNMATFYLDSMKQQAVQLGIASAVTFAGHVERSDLLAYYRAADVFVCMSEHEGFCVPIVEALALGVPVVAFHAAAVPGTLGSAGILVTQKRFDVVAELVNQIVSDPAFRQALVDGGRSRVAEFAKPRVESTLAAHIAALI